jgi:hypothetical protein
MKDGAIGRSRRRRFVALGRKEGKIVLIVSCLRNQRWMYKNY